MLSKFLGTDLWTNSHYKCVHRADMVTYCFIGAVISAIFATNSQISQAPGHQPANGTYDGIDQNDILSSQVFSCIGVDLFPS